MKKTPAAFLDPLDKRIGRQTRVDTATEPWFNVVEIEVNSRCNRSCSYCPVSLNLNPESILLMRDEVFNRILDDLVAIGFEGKVSYHFLNEPLLRKDLEHLVARVKRRLPHLYQLLYTNGDLLSDGRYKSLLESGISHFLVTRHDFSPIPTRSCQTVQYPTDLLPTNRGGTMRNIRILEDPMEQPCHAPSEMFVVTVGGDVLLCCDDARREYVMGNILHQSIGEIWNSPKFIYFRRELRNGRRDRGARICRGCSNQEYIMSGSNDFIL